MDDDHASTANSNNRDRETIQSEPARVGPGAAQPRQS